MDFVSDTPSNINELSDDEILALARDSYSKNKELSRKLAEAVYKILGYNLNNETKLATYDAGMCSLILSTAGGGKTTWSQIKAILFKMHKKVQNDKHFLGSNILSLVYNKHNVQDMKNRHRIMVERINNAFTDMKLDDMISAYTMHSFCEYWRKEYIAKTGLVGYTLASDYECETIMNRAIEISSKKLGYPILVQTKDMLNLYTFMCESLAELSELTDTEPFIQAGLDVNTAEYVMEQYGSSKKTRSKYDFCDMLVSVYKLLRDDENTRKNIQSHYQMIIADEVQDFTPLMWEILRLIRSENTVLIAIGDEDQSIYNFRGANIYRTLNFSQDFSDAKIFTLSQNHRCDREILDYAVSVISKNTMRFHKPIEGTHDGGNVTFAPYYSVISEVDQIEKQLLGMSNSDIMDTCICYRNTESSLLLSEMLRANNIPFYVLSGSKAMEFELYRHIFDVLNILECPNDRDLYRNLYKVLPVDKATLHKALGWDPKTHKWSTTDKFIHFAQVDYGNLRFIKGFDNVINLLSGLATSFAQQPVSTSAKVVYELLQTYFWKYRRSTLGINNDILCAMEKMILQFFDSNQKYREFNKAYLALKSNLNSNQEQRNGIALATFHSLKGLEFDNVIAVDLDSKIFPSFQSAGNVELSEGETRLWYVAITRARHNLTVYYNAETPSCYIPLGQLSGNATAPVGGTVNPVGATTMNVLPASPVEFDDDDDDDDDGFAVDSVSIVPEQKVVNMTATEVQAERVEVSEESKEGKAESKPAMQSAGSDYMTMLLNLV